MAEEIKTMFSRKLVYRQKDRAQNELGVFEAHSSVWAAAWSYEGLKHPVTTRIRVNIVHALGTNEFDPVSAEFEFWRENEWKLVDMCFQGYESLSSVELIEDECLYMAEAFLMGVNIDTVREKYGVDKADPESIQNTDDKEEENPNVLKLFPQKD